MSGTPQPPVNYGGNTGRPAIGLVAEPDVDTSASIGALVKDATVQMSTLVRAEIELAKLEVAASVKTALTGAVFFIVAGVIGLFSLFFFWFMIGEILDIWLPRWAAFTIVFGAMLAMVGLLAFLGIKKVKKVKKPERTISTLSETASTLKSAAKHSEPPAAR
ncbi:Putative Holin-X, holin superfamily III [Nakamurella panacisegetis]|uniref:Putative Holin-X, holin superfamily III n=1 Tax=Nakamurella panacisegetis TaxID=1090615 RepID=A0A1H0N9L5_9ACTN|nr:phage holin family protein [Nakamurella panacisegetis]SDO89216.1 Putative Holin-X, holin superfamily III [Nakamurella panacisegetis]